VLFVKMSSTLPNNMSTFQRQLETELRALCTCWNMPIPSLDELPHKTSLNGEQVEGEENVAYLGEMNTPLGPLQVFHSVDVRDLLGNTNWTRGWSSCLTHRPNQNSTTSPSTPTMSHAGPCR
jgi:hypothetical protein